jgi:hypothetical protein
MYSTVPYSFSPKLKASEAYKALPDRKKKTSPTFPSPPFLPPLPSPTSRRSNRTTAGYAATQNPATPAPLRGHANPPYGGNCAGIFRSLGFVCLVVARGYGFHRGGALRRQGGRPRRPTTASAGSQNLPSFTLPECSYRGRRAKSSTAYGGN